MELETSLNSQLKERNESLSDLQVRHNELQSEKEQLLATIEDFKLNLGQARSDIQQKAIIIEELTLSLGKAQSVIRQKDSTIGELTLDLGLTQAMIREKENTISDLDKTRREIETSLKEQIAQKDIKIEEIEGKLRVTFLDKILFDSGSTKIKDGGKEILLTLAESFGADTDKTIVVEGHTDNVEIGYPLRKRFPSNWELSTARAASVVRFLQEKANISPERLTASGFSFYRPVVPNDKDTRSQNRRIEIILVPIR
ncbi:MAG: OmpA family protein [Candidatus Binatia bacterium]